MVTALGGAAEAGAGATGKSAAELGEAVGKQVGKKVDEILAAKAAAKVDAEALAKARIDNNFYAENSLADPSKTMSASGPWTPSSLLNKEQAGAMVESSIPVGAKVDRILSADTANAKIIADSNGKYQPSYMPGTDIMEFSTSAAEQFVRVSGGDSRPTANWIMRASDIQGLTPEQIASKFALPAVPTQIGEVTIPAGTKLQASVANGILRGGNPGGGGVQFYIPLAPIDLPPQWFGATKAFNGS